jgi:hypothetical protein
MTLNAMRAKSTVGALSEMVTAAATPLLLVIVTVDEGRLVDAGVGGAGIG